jgi:proline iminopeptidase
MSQFTRRTALSFGTAAMAAPRAFAAATGQPVTEGRAKVPGGTIWWMKVGNGGKTPLLTLHGGPGAGHNYLLPLKALADERPVVFYDQLGCGKADSPQDEKIYTIQRSVDELDAVRRALGLEKIVLFGHSWGSMLAIEYMCQGRGKGVEKLVLGGALASVPQTNAGQMRLIAALPNGDGAKLRALEKAHKEQSPEYQRITDEFYARHVLRANPPPPDAAASFDIVGKSIAYRVMNGPNEFTIVGVIKGWDRRKDLGRIKVPTLIVTGTYDEVTLDCHQTIQKGIKGSKLVILPGCSHMAMDEKPELYVSTLRKFIA